MQIRKGFTKYRVLMVAYFAMMLSVTGMYTLYIINSGFSKMEISITVTIFSFSTLLGQNILGYLSDKFGHVKKILLPSIGIGVFIAVGLYYAKQHWQIECLVFVWGFFIYGSIPLIEAWIIGVLKKAEEQKNFGKIRGFGSIGYGLAGVFLGLCLQKFGWGIFYWYILITVIVTLIVIFTIKEDENIEFYKIAAGKTSSNSGVSLKEAFAEIVRIKQLRAIVIIVFIYLFVVKGIYSYLGILVSDLGGGPLSLGLTYFFDATPEIITFFLASRLLIRFSSKWLIFVSFLLQIVRLVLILVFNSSLAIILLGPLSGFAFGLLAAAYKTYIYELAPEKYKISCLSLSESIIGLSGVISAPVFGFIIMKFGGNTAIAMGLAVDVFAAIYLMWDLYKVKNR